MKRITSIYLHCKNANKKLKKLSFSPQLGTFFPKWAFFFSNQQIIRQFEKKNAHPEKKVPNFDEKEQIFSHYFSQCRFTNIITWSVNIILRTVGEKNTSFSPNFSMFYVSVITWNVKVLLYTAVSD